MFSLLNIVIFLYLGALTVALAGVFFLISKINHKIEILQEAGGAEERIAKLEKALYLSIKNPSLARRKIKDN